MFKRTYIIIFILPLVLLASDVDSSLYKKVTSNSWYIKKFNENIVAIDTLIKDKSIVSDSKLLEQMYYWKIDNYFAGKKSVYNGIGNFICQYRNIGSSINEFKLTEQAKIDILEGTRVEKCGKIVGNIGVATLGVGIVLGLVRLCILIGNYSGLIVGRESYPVLTTSAFSLIFGSTPIIITGFGIGIGGYIKIGNSFYLHNGRLISEKY